MEKKLVPLAFQVAILSLALTCIAGERVPCKEYPFTERPVVTSIDGVWVGNAISYGPFREGHEPGGDSPSKDQIREDLHILADHWQLLRLYGVNQCAREVLEVVREDGLPLKVMLGVWLYPASAEEGVEDTSEEEIRKDIAEAVALTKEFPEVVWAICVGNESQVSWSGHRVPLELLIRCIRDVRGKTCVPVTAADDFEFWLDDTSSAVADEIDFIVMHAHPVWHGLEAENALEFVKECYSAVSEKHSDKLVVIGETGWATDKDPRDAKENASRARWVRKSSSWPVHN